ncbi:MAG: isoprenylcysteine carboxylmethyltransferase family protein [Acidobacteriia bacterium]|nr:isoprenylcysteine carboxylmethyltransferase family protein [Terriglobia bacterium]
MTGKLLALVYGLFAYAVFLAVFLYLIGFLANRYALNTIDSGLQIPLAEAWPRDLALLVLFGAQHSVMARDWCKRASRRLIPQPVERSTYVLMTCVALAALFRYWEPMPNLVWDVRHPIGSRLLDGMFLAGWGLVAVATVQIGHGELTGLRQVWMYARGVTPAPPQFRTPGIYRYVRHPMMLGMLIALWSTAAMSLGHLLFSGVLSLYILLALGWEERDLDRAHPEDYERYRERVGRLLPR